MNRNQALGVLHLDESSDSHAVETSYWTLVRHAQTRSPDEATAAREVERLNAAYAALAPSPSRMQRAASDRPVADRAKSAVGITATPAIRSDNQVDAALDWLSAEFARVRTRWEGRNAEVALIAGAALALSAVAMTAGANILVVLACVVVLLVGIWCPWQDTPPDEPD